MQETVSPFLLKLLHRMRRNMADPVRHRDLETYLERAEDARAQAETATLANVRERCLRAEAAWREMAARVQRTEKMRATLIAAREELSGAAPA